MPIRRLLTALGATLLLIGLAWACPADGANRGPALLSILGKWHLLALHLPAALVFALPVIELAQRDETPSRPVRLLADLTAGGAWIATALGIFHGHFNGFDGGAGTDIERHLRLGVVAAGLAALAWAGMDLGRRARLTLQALAATAVVLAAHVGGELVHEEGFLTTPSKPDAAGKPEAGWRGFQLVPSAVAAEPAATASPFPPNATVAKTAETLARELGVTAVPRAIETDAGLLVATHTVTTQFGDAQLAKLAQSGAQIAELDLSRTRVTDAAAGTLSRFSHLEALALGDTQVGDGVARVAAGLPSLRRLVLRGTRLTDAGLAALVKAPALETLYVGQTSCTAGAIEALRKSKPGLQVIGNVTLAEVTVPPPPTKEAMAKAAEAKRAKK